MDQGQGAPVVLRLEVQVEPAKLADQEHSFVDHGAGGQGDHIGPAVGLFKYPAGHEQAAVKVQPPGRPLRTAHKALPDSGHGGQGHGAEQPRIHWDLPPAQKGQPFPGADSLEARLLRPARFGRPGQKEHPYAVVPGIPKADAQLLPHPAEEGVADLEHDADAVADLPGGVLPGPVLQLLHDGQGVVHHAVAGDPVDADHRTDAAGVVLKGRVV